MIVDREGKCGRNRESPANQFPRQRSCGSVVLPASPFQVQTRLWRTRQQLAVKEKAASEELGRERRWRQGSGVKAHLALHIGKNAILREAQPTTEGASGIEMAR